jgi:hypothetical protein
MKNPIFISLSFLTLTQFNLAFGQESEKKPNQILADDYQLHVGVSDIFIFNVGVEASFKIAENQYLGARLSPVFLLEDFDSRYSSSNWGGQAQIVHLYYLPSSYNNSTSRVFYFLRSSLSITGANLNYTVTDWFPINEKGLELLNYETRSFDETVYRSDIAFALGMQSGGKGPLFWELFLGLRYGGSLNNGNLEATAECENCFEDDYNFSYFRDTYVMPVIGLNLVFGHNPDKN